MRDTIAAALDEVQGTLDWTTDDLAHAVVDALAAAEGGDVPNQPTPAAGWVILTSNLPEHGGWQPDWDGRLHQDRREAEAEANRAVAALGVDGVRVAAVAAGGAVAVPPEPEDWRQCGACGWAGPESAWDDEDHAVRHDRPAVAVPEDRPQITEAMLHAAAEAVHDIDCWCISGPHEGDRALAAAAVRAALGAPQPSPEPEGDAP